MELLSSNVHFHEVNVPEYPLFHYQPYELALSSKLVNVIRNHRIDLLHVHYAIPHAYAGYMAKKMLQSEGITIPMVTTLHGTDITLVGNHPFYKPAVTFSINNSDVITCVSESLKQDTLRHFEVTKDIDVVHNFIDTNVSEKVFTDCQRDLMAEADEKIITHISNLRPVKRLNDVVSVFYKIQQSIKAKLIIVGEGPEREAAEQLIKEYDIANNVIFVGQSNEIDKILCFSDLFLLPSEAESFGLAALEAMVDGVPVISSNAGGLPEVNIHGESGFLSDVGDIDDMAANALKIFKDEKTLKEFKERAKKVAKSFDINTIVPKYESLYQKAIDNIFA